MRRNPEGWQWTKRAQARWPAAWPSQSDVVRYLAARLPWGSLGGQPELLERFLDDVGSEDRDTYRDWTDLHDLSDRWEHFEFLPPVHPGDLRCHHSILKHGPPASTVALLVKIASEGLVPQPEAAGRSSELPSAVFAVVEEGCGVDGLYNRHTSYVTFDLPTDEWPWTHFKNYRPGNVVVVSAVPPELIVGINGVPVREFLAGVRQWVPEVPRKNPMRRGKR